MTFPQILIPGFMLEETLWDDMITAFATPQAFIRVSLKGDLDMDGLVEKVAAETTGRSVLVGFSLGGYVARAFALKFPERVAALILIATSLRPDTSAQQAMKQAAVAASSNKPFRGLSLSAIRRSLHPSHAFDNALIDRIRAMGVGLGHQTFAAQIDLGRKRGDTCAIQCPTLIVAGRDDALRSLEEAEELRDAIPGAELRIIEDTGHMIPLEQPARLASVIEKWLATVAPCETTD